MTHHVIYTEIAGLICTDVVRADGLDEPKGGDIKVDEVIRPGCDFGSVYRSGRKPRTWTANFRFLTEEDLDEFMEYANQEHPEDLEFYPRRSDRSVYIAVCHAEILAPEDASIGGVWTTFWKARATIVSREAWTYGADQYLFNQPAVALPAVSAAITNNGHKASGLDYFGAAGGYFGEYVTDLSVRFTPLTSSVELDKQILLCDQMMVNDAFEIDRWGNVRHTYENLLACTYGRLQTDLWGSTYCSGGSIGAGILTIGNSGKVIMPFSGPIKISGENPFIEIYVTALTGTPAIKAGVLANLSDLAIISTSLQLGHNKVFIPGYVGETDLYFGIVCGASDSISISSLKGSVHRYIAESQIPKEDPGDTFVMRVDGAGCFGMLVATYRDLFRI